MLINPYQFGRLWTPADITTALWLDAADASTVTTVSGAVSQWNDKSGNGRNVGQSTAANRPAYTAAGQNGLNTIQFDGSNDCLDLASDMSLGTSHNIFIVAQNQSTITASSSNQMLFVGGSWSSPSTTTSSVFLSSGAATSLMAGERLSYLVAANNGSNSTGVYGYGKANADVSGAFILNVGYTTSGNAFTGRLNGATDFTTTTVAGGFITTMTRYPTFFRRIGLSLDGSSGWNGSILEIIVTPAYLSSATLEITEGYLAHKWGLAASLPAGHPYKSAAPTV